MEQPELVTLFDAAPAVVSVMNRAEAEKCEAEIISTGSRLRALLVDFYERRGWDALGYSSWDNWAGTVFPDSTRHAYRALVAGLAERAIVTNWSELGNTPESQLRPLSAFVALPRGPNTPDRQPQIDEEAIRDTWERARELAADEGKVLTARHVSVAVQEYRAGAPLPYDREPLPADEEPTAYEPPVTRFNEGMRSSESAEWYTPARILDVAREMLGGFDTDPASSQAAQQAVQAATWYGLDHPDPRNRDGLAREWPGRVWMNPPYGDAIGEWVARLVHQYDHEITTEALALLPGRLDTGWWQDNLGRFAFCVLRGRLKFSGAENSAPFPSVIVYLGDNPLLFARTFGRLGIVYRPA